MKLIDVLISKKDIQKIDQESDLIECFVLDLKKALVNVSNFVRRDKDKMERNQILGHYLK